MYATRLGNFVKSVGHIAERAGDVSGNVDRSRMGFHEGLDARRHERASVLRAHAVLPAPHAVLVTRAAVQLQPERANEAEEDVAGDDGVHVALEAFTFTFYA